MFAAAMSAYHWDFTALSTEKYETNQYAVIDEFKGISISTDTSDISFAPSEDNQCRVVCHERAEERRSPFVKDGVLIIDSEEKGTDKWYKYINISFDSPKITVYLPEAEYDSLFIKTSTGSVEIPDGFSFANTEISLVTGDINFSASAYEYAKLRTDTGNITVKNTATGMLDIYTSIGDVKVLGVDSAGDIKINSETGNTSLTDIKCENLVSIGEMGDISLRNVIAANKFHIENDTGSVEFDRSDAVEIFVKVDMGDIKGSLLTDKIFIAESDMGNVNVPRTVSGGRCELITDTGDIEINYM